VEGREGGRGLLIRDRDGKGREKVNEGRERGDGYERREKGGRAGACPTNKKIVPVPLPENGSFCNTEYLEKIPAFH